MRGIYMAYNESRKRASMKYVKERLHSVTLRYRKEEWESAIEPAIAKSGLPVATFVKEAIDEKIKRGV